MPYDVDGDWYDEEPTTIPELDNAIKLESNLVIDVRLLDHAIKNYVSNNFHSILDAYIQREVEKCIKNEWQSQANLKDSLENVILAKFEEVYPDAVENKINEFEKTIREYKFQWNGRHSAETLQKKAMQKVDDYIENELVDSVKKSTDYVEQFSRNYFANNLFRAMGMMDKMIPQADSESITSK